MTVDGKILGGVAQFFALGHAELLGHEVQPRDHLGGRMLDLEARVHFHEVEIEIRVHQKLDCAGVFVADRLGGAHGGGAHFGALLGRED